MTEPAGGWEARRAALLEAARDGLLLVDRGRIIEANDAATRLLGRALDELLGVEIAGLFEPGQGGRAPFEGDAAEAGPRQATLVQRSGARLPVEVSSRAALYLGNPVRAVNIRELAADRRAASAGSQIGVVIEDVTRRKCVEDELRAAKERAEAAERDAAAARARLMDAIETLPEGFALFDAEDRFVLCNSRYREIYAENADLIVPGLRFEDMLRTSTRRGQYLDAHDREETWIAARLAQHRDLQGSHEQRLPNGRWLRIQERRTSDGGSVGVRIDITELKQREHELRRLNDTLEQRVAERTRELTESEMRLRTLFETLTQGVVFQDERGVVTGANPASERILGVSAAQMLGTTSSDPIWHRTDETGRPLAPDEYASSIALRTGEVVRNRVVRIVNPKLGEQRWLMIDAIPQFRPGARGIQGVCTLFSDITDQRRANIALRESEARFRNMADHAPVMIWMSNSEGVCTFVSQQWCDFTGQELTAALGLGWQECLHPDDRLRVRSLGLPTAPFRAEYRLRRHDGEWRWVLDAASPRLGEDGTVIGYVGSIVDITDRKLQEEELSRLADRQSAILDALPAHVAFLDAEGTIVAVNQAWRRFAAERGLPGAAGLGHGYIAVCEAIGGPALAASIADELPAVLAGSSEGVERDYPCHTATVERWFRLLAAPIAPGRRAGAVVVHLDVTAARQTEAALHQAQKMETLGQLTGGVAHDFNNLLTAVIGNLDLLGRHVSSERGRHLLSVAVSAAERGATLTQRLLAFARRQRLAPEVVEIPELVAGMDALLARSVGPLTRLDKAFPPGTWRARVDRNQLELMLLNLALNAHDAMPQGGTLAIAAANERIDSPGHKAGLLPGDYVRVLVADTGIGMAPEILAHAGEPFFTTKEVGKGSGLGLAMVHGVAVQSGGGMHIESAPGRGTTVNVWLPRAVAETATERRAATALAPDRAALGRLAGASVLVIDDDPEVRQFIIACLEQARCEVLSATSGPEGLKRIEERAVDLLITDFAMPGMTGFQTAVAARERRPGLPVLIITGYADAQALQETGLPILQKPFASNELTGSVAHLLPRRRGRVRPSRAP